MEFFTDETLIEVLSEFPALWDPQDLYFKDESIRTKCWKKLLEKCQAMTLLPVPVDALESKLKVVLKRKTMVTVRQGPIAFDSGRRYRKADQNWMVKMEQLTAEYPCLWDASDMNYGDRGIRNKCLRQLLEKYNSMASEPITISSLKNKLRNMFRRMARGQRPRTELLDKLARSAEESGDQLSDQDANASSDSLCNVAVNDQIQWVVQNDASTLVPGMLTLVFHCCCFCGEVKNDCTTIVDKPYVTNGTLPWFQPGKITLTLNELTVNLDFDKETTPKTVCHSCDIKMKEISDFVKLVKKAQDKMNIVETIDISEDNKDDITVTDTEVTNKRKRSDEEKKTCSVTIDLNPPDNDVNKMVDIEAKYKMFKRDNIATATVTSSDKIEDASRDITESEDNVTVKVENDSDNSNDNESNQVLNTQSENVRTLNNETAISNNIATVSNNIATVSNNIATVSNNIATVSNIVSGAVNSEKTEVAGSSVSGSNKNEVWLIPKGELIQLVESIVSRMLNK